MEHQVYATLKFLGNTAGKGKYTHSGEMESPVFQELRIFPELLRLLCKQKWTICKTVSPDHAELFNTSFRNCVEHT